MKLTVKALSFLAVVSLLAPMMVFAFETSPSEPIKSGYTVTDLFDRVNALVDWVFAFIILLSVIFVIIGGFQFVTGGPEGAAKARQNLIWAAVGIGFAILARVLPTILEGFLK